MHTKAAMIPFVPDFQHYLAAKATVDDRALNANVRTHIFNDLRATTSSLRVLEIGCGTGTMISRLHASDAFDGLPVDYTALDNQPANIAQVATVNVPPTTCITPVLAGFHDFAANAIHDNQTYDLLIAHAVLDLFDLRQTLPQMRQLLRPGARAWLTLNFDGATIFEPAIDPIFDADIERAYHQTMNARQIDGALSGDSQSGRHLFTALPAAGFNILAAGASDWVVHPLSGAYPHDEAYFLHFIVHTIGRALADHPEIDATRFSAWLDKRHRQIEDAQLVYIAHQLDFAAQAT